MTANPNQHWGGENHTSVSRFVTRIVYYQKLISKYGQNEYSQALNASYTFQPLMGFCRYLMMAEVPSSLSKIIEIGDIKCKAVF